MGFPGSSDCKESACTAGDLGSVPGLGGYPRGRQWHPTPVLLPGKSHGQRSLVGCRLWGREESDTTERLHFHFSLSCIGEGNGNPLQCSCLENPRDGVAQSQTRLKRLSSSSSSQSFRRPWANSSVYSIISFPTASTPAQDLRITKLYSTKGSFEVIPSNLLYFMMRNRDGKR